MNVPRRRLNGRVTVAYHELRLYWLQTVPGYRDELRREVDRAARRAESLSNRIDASHAERDYLNSETPP